MTITKVVIYDRMGCRSWGVTFYIGSIAPADEVDVIPIPTTR